MSKATTHFGPLRSAVAGGFYMYTITKDGPDVHTTKKFGDTSVPSHFFVLTSVPLWIEGMLTEVTELQKVHNALGCPKIGLPSMPFCFASKI